MASTYGNDLRLEEIGDGEQSGTWGATTNTNLELIAEALSFGTEAITTNADTHTTTIADGATDPGRSLYLKYTGTLDSTCTITIAPNSISKTWYIENGTSGSQSIIISQGSGANVTIPTGQTKIVYSDGAGSGAAMAEIGTLGVTNLAVTTNATIGGTLDTSGAVNLNLDTDSTSSTSGALIVDGGVGIAKKLFIGTDLDVGGTTNLDAVDIDGAVQLDATLTVGVDDTGYDVKFFGDTASAFMQWDASVDDLILGGAAGLIVPEGQFTIASTPMTSSAADLNQLDGKVAKTAGLETIWVPATAISPTTTNGCTALASVETTAGKPDMVVLAFPVAADSFAQFSIAFPKSWNAGTVTYQVFWSGIAATTNVNWTVQAVAISNDTSIDVDYGTAIAVTDAAQGAVEELNVSAVSGALTIAGSPGDDELCYFRFGRDVSAGDMAGDAQLHGIKLFFTTDLANDD